MTALRDDLFINDLAGEYNTLFFTGLRKVLAEQTYVDWMFKTSFINAKNSVRQVRPEEDVHHRNRFMDRELHQ